MFQNSFNLRAVNALEPLKKIVNGSSILKIFKQREDWNPCIAEDPSGANPLRIAFDSMALAPVAHGWIVVRGLMIDKRSKLGSNSCVILMSYCLQT